MEGWGSIAVATRLEKLVENKFFVVWSELITRGLRKDKGDGFLIIKDQVAHWALNMLVRQFLKSPCDTLFLLDSDADIGWNFLNEFRDFEDGWKFDVFQPFFTRRGWPPEAIWFYQRDDGHYVNCVVTEDNFTAQVAACGTHALLIRRRVFETLLGDNDPETFQWFYYPRDKKMSEDVAFSRDAVNAGFMLGATTTFKVGHISRVTTGWETYQEYVAINGVHPEALADAQRYMEGQRNGQVH